MLTTLNKGDFMNTFETVFTETVRAAETASAAKEDYINPANGLKYCWKCHTPKEAFFDKAFCFAGIDRHPIDCQCVADEKARQEHIRMEAERS